MKSFPSLPFLSLFLLLLSCTSEKQENPTAQSSETLEGKEILVGAVFALTGPLATYGQESINGAKLALEKINAQGIHGRKIRFISEDNKGDPTESANATRKLIDVDKVHLIFGSVASSNTLAAAPIAQKAKVPLVTPASTNEEVTKTGDYIFRTCFSDNFQGKVMAKFARKDLGKKKAVIIIDVASDYSRGLSAAFKKNFEQLGGSIASGAFAYNQGDRDFRSLLKKVSRARPDMIFLPGYYTEVGIMLQQAQQMGINIPFLGGDGWDSPKLQELAGPKAIKGHYMSSHFSAGDQDPVVKDFVKKYQAKFSQTPGAMAALAYDGIMLVADAFRRLGNNLSHEAIRKALSETKDFSGITGSTTIDENRNAQKSAVILETMPNGMAFRKKIDP